MEGNDQGLATPAADPVEAYCQLVRKFAAPQEKPSAESLIAVLLARDQAAAAMQENHNSVDRITRLAVADEMLKRAGRNSSLVLELERLRSTLLPAESAWWWRLDEGSTSTWTTILAGLLLTGAVAFAADVSSRFLANGPDIYGVFATGAQALLTFMAGTSFTAAGRAWMKKRLMPLRIAPKFHPASELGAAILVLAVVLALRLGLPSFARSYNRSGVEAQQDGRIENAVAKFQRAINLSPDNAEAHYNLASAWEDVADYDKAITEYQIALRDRSNFIAAANNLARVLILRKQDYNTALKLIDDYLPRIPAGDKDAEYKMYKNRAWANFGLKNYKMAEKDLRTAERINPSGAAAQCLLAQVKEAQNDAAAAKLLWNACFESQSSMREAEPAWRWTAQEKR